MTPEVRITTEDSHLRSIAKGISWRFFGTIDTIILALIFTGSIKKALTIGFIEFTTKILLYYLHERVWTKIHYGIRVGRDNNPYEMSRRSIAKGASWRIVATFDTTLISLLVTRNPFQTINISVTEIFTKIFLFWAHERLWLRVPWGRIHGNQGKCN